MWGVMGEGWVVYGGEGGGRRERKVCRIRTTIPCSPHTTLYCPAAILLYVAFAEVAGIGVLRAVGLRSFVGRWWGVVRNCHGGWMIEDAGSKW